jgi:uncharacterized sporulation protein YeaH/YhbH (DUF444 family)
MNNFIHGAYSRIGIMDKLPKTSYIFVDRRPLGRGKSLGNRQRLLRRITDAIRQAKPQDIDAGGIKNISGSSPQSNANPVKVTRQSLREPTFHYAHRTGVHDVVLIGNREWERGDEFPINDGEDEQAVGGPGEDGEDDFIVNVSRDEFFNVFFEDCALPDLVQTHEKELPELMPKHAGFQKEGTPAQLNVVRSFKNALPRKRALTRLAREELISLREHRAELVQQLTLDQDRTNVDEIQAELAVIDAQIDFLTKKISAVPFFEKLDLRYTKQEKVLVKSADAVFCMVMDISGSMSEDKKRMARKFFSLQYAFIKRKYPQTDLVFIAHTDDAEEMTEEEFFTTRKSGGTIVSPAYILLNKIINTRYDANNTNIYLSQASDGDNWDSDNVLLIPELETSGLLSKLRYMSYAQVGQSFASSYSSGSTLWSVLQSIANTSKKLAMVKIMDDSDVFDAFHKIYKKPSE